MMASDLENEIVATLLRVKTGQTGISKAVLEIEYAIFREIGFHMLLSDVIEREQETPEA
jgi:hypothetical protein